MSKPSPIKDAKEDSLCFCARTGDLGLELTRTTKAKVIVCPDTLDLSSQSDIDKTFISVVNPRLAMIDVLNQFFVPLTLHGIHTATVLGKDVNVHETVSIGPNTVIGHNCYIGQGSVIESNVTVYPGTRIGDRVFVQSGAVIGAGGFGFERDSSGEWLKFPQIGGVLIENDVEIGANACIDRGTLSDTVIGQGTKIDDLSYIDHNVLVGKRCIIVMSFLGGSVVVGTTHGSGPKLRYGTA